MVRANLAETPDFDLGGLHVSPARREVRMNGERRELEPKVLQVLIALASERPAVVSRDRLVEQCWGGRAVGDDTLNRCIVALRHLARDFSPQPFAIETIRGVGYSLVERPIEPPATRAGGRQARVRVAAAALLILLFIAAGVALTSFPVGRGQPAPVSIAVLPFRNLSGGDPYFAEGIGEEILGQLGRDPQFRVAGSNSTRLVGNGAEILDVARRLGVDYVLEGSVRRQGDRVRVDAGLVRASDGMRLWSDSYDGSLDDMFAIQQRIGGAIAGALRLRLLRAPAAAGPLVTSGEAYNLYLTARGLIRTNNRRMGGTAADLLRDAINHDPGYAPAWASLATAVRMDGAMHGHEGLIAATLPAQAHARHAILLAPDLAEAHRALGMAIGYGTPEAQFHLRRAAQLEPSSAENMIWLGVAQGAAGEFEAEIAAYRRAVELDPFWFRGVKQLAVAFAEMGNRAEAEAAARRGHPNDEISQNLLLGRIAWVFGDFSEAARRWSIVARSNSPRWSDTARRSMYDATFAVGLRTGPLVVVPPPDDQRRATLVRMDAPPAPSVWRSRNRNRVATEVYREENHVAAKLMLSAGRGRELAAAYDGPLGLLGLRPGRALRVDQVGQVPLVALVLRQSGRAAEADRLLREADRTIRTLYRRGAAPFWFDADAAGVWAAQGRGEQAMSMLERAMDRGWTHSGGTDLADIADEPAFRSLHRSQRFQRLRAALNAQRARERNEISQLRM